jgi:predicted dehydrogenase
MPKQRLLIIGVGSIGERHLRCAQHIEGVQPIICEIDAELRQAVAKRYGIRETFSELDSALAASPTAAAICVPAHLHVSIATRLVKTGIHVLIEKPLSTSSDGVEQLRELVADRGVVAAVAYIYRANPILFALREAVNSGRFGRPVQLVATAGQNFAFYRPAYRNTYYKNRATGGGAIQDALTHLINAGEWLIGPVDCVLADAAHQMIPDVTVEDTVHVISRQQGVPACYTLNQYQAPNEITITVVCERGALRYEAHENRWRWMTEPGNAWHDEACPTIERDSLFIKQLEVFFNAIEHSTPPLCTLEEGVQTLRTNLAILKSLQNAQWTNCVSTSHSKNPSLHDVQ